MGAGDGLCSYLWARLNTLTLKNFTLFGCISGKITLLTGKGQHFGAQQKVSRHCNTLLEASRAKYWQW